MGISGMWSVLIPLEPPEGVKLSLLLVWAETRWVGSISPSAISLLNSGCWLDISLWNEELDRVCCWVVTFSN